MPITPLQRLGLFVAFLVGTGLICLVLSVVIRVLMRRHPEWFLTERQLEDMGHATESYIRREQAKDVLYGSPEDEVEMVPANCDI